jgi:hypothetical protein
MNSIQILFWQSFFTFLTIMLLMRVDDRKWHRRLWHSWISLPLFITFLGSGMMVFVTLAILALR